VDDLLSEFLTETNEAIDSLDVEIVRLEQEPNDPELLGSIFRLVHTFKGACGFLGLPRLESVAHAAENVLGKFRDGELPVTPDAVTIILESIDTIKELLGVLAETEAEPEGDDSNLIGRLNAFANGEAASTAPIDSNEPDPVSDPSADTAASHSDEEPVSDEASHSTDADAASGTGTGDLLERVGGISAINAAIENFCHKLLKDEDLARLYEGADPIILQGKLVEYTVALAGGPDN